MGFLDRVQHRGEKQPEPGHATVTGSAFEIWGQRGCASVDIVGESFHADAIRGTLGSGVLPADGIEVFTQVHLVHNYLNVHDTNAIEIHGATGVLGHLSRQDAVRYAPVVDELQGQGLIATTAARVWGGHRPDQKTGAPTFIGSARIDLPEPHMMFPHNQAPAHPHQLLPYGSAIRVTTGSDGGEAIRRYLCPAGECWVYATIDEVVDQGARTPKPVAQVSIDSTPVGLLTPKMSADVLPVVRFLAQRGFGTAVRAIVKGNALKSDVVLHTPRAGDLPQEWIDGLPAASPSSTSPITAPVINNPTPELPARTDDIATRHPSSSTPAPVSGSPIPPTPPVATTPAAGWYPDPHRLARLRWWNGASWTEHIAP